MERLSQARARKLVVATALICAAGGVAAIVLVSRGDPAGDALDDQLLDTPIDVAPIRLPADPLTRELVLETIARTQAQNEARSELAELRAKYGEPVRASGPPEAECWHWPRQRVYFCTDDVTGEGWSYRLPERDG